jgi:hypothetical protein
VSNLEANLKAVSAERDDLRREVISNHTHSSSSSSSSSSSHIHIALSMWTAKGDSSSMLIPLLSYLLTMF